MISGIALPGELVSVPPVTFRLLDFARSGKRQEADAYRLLLRICGCREPDGVFEELRVAGFFTGRPEGLAISSHAYRALLFVSGALGVGSQGVFDELRSVEPSLHRYELVREGMTSRFIKGLLTEPGFQRLYICSPWINLKKEDLGRLAAALHKEARSLTRQPEILVLVQTPKYAEVTKTLDVLRSLGAKVVEKPKLHSKLYMREPGPSGGLSLAIVGSENLTRPKWIELGIEIRNDSYILSRLRNYFFDVFGRLSGE
ncbi:MAG: hypothetical protein ACRD2L_14665 [Terriglobia bacterium]